MNFSFEVNNQSSEPIFVQLAKAISRSIDCGKIKASTALPPTRELATTLRLSRDTIVRAYRELERLSYVTVCSTRGTFVLPRDAQLTSDHGLTSVAIELDESTLSSFGRQALKQMFKHPSTPSFVALNYGAVPRSALPMRRWRELMQQLCVPETFRKIEYEPNVLGRAELRKAIAAYLWRTKGMECDWRQVVIFSLSSGIISMLYNLLLEPGAVIAVEEPGYGAVKNHAKIRGIGLLPVPVDDQGFSVDALKGHEDSIKLVYVTASHHDPSGIVMSLDRRKELLTWADDHNVWIIEDDYDGHFYYTGAPPPNLWSLHPERNVIYSSTFWQVLYPLATIGFAVVPKKLIPVVAAAKDLQTEGIADFMVQMTLTRMLDEGYLEKHLRKIQKSFAQKRITLIFELKRQLGKQIEICNESAGNYFVVYLHDWQQKNVEAAAREADLPLVSTATYYLQDAKPNEYLINFALLQQEEITGKVSAFVTALKLG